MAKERFDQNSKIEFELDRSLALVLFEFLARVADEQDGEPLAGTLDHDAELPALWALLALLEEHLDEPFADDYRDRIKQARETILRRFGKSR